MAKYDDLIKQLARLRPEDFVQWVCPQVRRIEKVSFEDREFELTYRRVDILYRVKAQETGEFLVHLEFQASLRGDFSIRLHEYSTRIRRQFKLPVRTVVVFLKATQDIQRLEPVDRFELAGEVISEFRYTKIILPKEEWKTIIAKGIPALWPLISLSQIPKGEEHQALSKAAECVEALLDANLRGELAAVLYLLGGYRYSETVEKVIKEKLMQELMQSKTYQKVAEMERRTGKLEGEVAALCKILYQRFGKIPAKLQKQLNAIRSVEELDRLIDIALASNSLSEFKSQVKDQ